jgi:hypothetical protein
MEARAGLQNAAKRACINCQQAPWMTGPADSRKALDEHSAGFSSRSYDCLGAIIDSAGVDVVA